MNDFMRRLTALIKKEYKQLLRDQSSLIIGIVIPIMLILLIGYGMSLDVKNVPVAVVLEDTSPTVQDMLSFMTGSDYIDPQYVTSMKQAQALMDQRKVDAILRIPPDFTRQLYRGSSRVQLILWGVDVATARSAGGYVEAGIGQWQAAHASEYLAGTSAGNMGSVTVMARQWFNDANTSTWFFIPGLVVLIVTLTGVFLTTMVMAREWERGTLEAIFVTPVRAIEILLAKMIPYFCVAMAGFWLCMLAARFLFAVPVHGSFLLILLSSVIYLMVALGMGLTISSVFKNQFLACQMSMVIAMLPTMMLSGFIFDLRSVPYFISVVGHILPATYYMELLKSLFLTGNNWYLIGRNCAVLLLYAVCFVGLSLHVTKKRLE